jgi:hypothetical protein
MHFDQLVTWRSVGCGIRFNGQCEEREGPYVCVCLNVSVERGLGRGVI